MFETKPFPSELNFAAGGNCQLMQVASTLSGPHTQWPAHSVASTLSGQHTQWQPVASRS